MADFSNGLALVTGGSHRLGREFSLALGKRGFTILLHYFHSGDLAAETAGLLREMGISVHMEQADLCIPVEAERLAERAAGLDLPWTVLINSAAIMPGATIGKMSLEEWDRVMALNLRAPLLLSRLAQRSMPEGGLIVNITDAGASRPWTGYPAYTVSKAALETLTRVLAKSFAPRLRVNAIAPGLVLAGEDTSPVEWQRLVARLPMGRSTPAADVVTALEYLLENRSVTGQTITVDGGYSLL